jgi:superfamily II DNA helicase RecQ
VSESVRAARGVAGRLGIRSLYREQERAIEASLSGQDVLVVLPTGFGKYLC